MTAHDDIDDLLKEGIAIFQSEIKAIKDKQPLGKSDADKLIEYLKTLVIIRKDWRLAEKENSLDTKSMAGDELDEAILQEAEKIKLKRNNA